MKEDKLFFQDNLSLNKLSEANSESDNHISEMFAQFLDTKFSSFSMAFELFINLNLGTYPMIDVFFKNIHWDRATT
jgi:hypothetical protein